MDQLFHTPGFLGTSANFLTDMTLLLSLIVATALTIGFLLARKGNIRTHRIVQTASAGTNLVLVLWLMILPFRDFIIPGLPDRLGERFYTVTTIHALVGACALVFGMYVVLAANGLMPRALRFRNYKPFMRVAYSLYIAATLIGIIVYLSWFVWNPNPPTFG